VQLLTIKSFVQTGCRGLVAQSYQIKAKNGSADTQGVGCANVPENTQECSCCVGDLNDDHLIGTLDLMELISNWGMMNYISDVDLDGIVGTSDLLKIIAAFGISCQ
jgi:hypothetical protein